MSNATGQGQPTGSPWAPPPVGAMGPPVPAARRRHVVRWVVLGVAVVFLLLPALLVVWGVVSAQQREQQPPQSLFDDASALGTALEQLSVPVDANGGGGSLTGQLSYQPTDPLPVRVSPRSVRIENGAVGPPTVVHLGAGNSATLTGTVGRFCVRVSHQGAQAMFFDSTWRSVQYGRGRSGACS